MNCLIVKEWLRPETIQHLDHEFSIAKWIAKLFGNIKTKFRDRQIEILYLGGLKQTFYLDAWRLQGYPLCEIDFIYFWIGF